MYFPFRSDYISHFRNYYSNFPTFFSGVIIENTYLLTCHHVRRRSTETHDQVHQEISSHAKVRFADQQKVLSRKKRQLWRIPQQSFLPQHQQQQIPSDLEDISHFNDARYVYIYRVGTWNFCFCAYICKLSMWGKIVLEIIIWVFFLIINITD